VDHLGLIKGIFDTVHIVTAVAVESINVAKRNRKG